MITAKVESVTPSKSGKALRVKLGDTWYGAKKDSGLDKAIGQDIEAEVEDGDFGLWITKWIAHTQGAATDPQRVSGNGTPWWAAFVSNTVAHAIAAGRIQTPDQIQAWAEKAHRTINDLPAF